MPKAIYATLAAAAVLALTGPASQVSAMPIDSSAAIASAGQTSGTATPVRYRRHHHYWAWPGPDWSPRHYWYAPSLPYPHYDMWGHYWADFWYDPGSYWRCAKHQSRCM